MPDARFIRDASEQLLTLAAGVSIGEIWQMPDGRAGYFHQTAAGSSGEDKEFTTSGVVTVTKTNGVQILKGGRVYWDHSAGSATYKPVNDRDFYIGTAASDAESGDLTLEVNLNAQPEYLVDLARDAFITAITGTQAVSGCNILRRGGAHNFVLNSTSEIQKLDALSVNGFAPGSNFIIEGAFRVPNDGAGTNTDVSLGAASATHGTDADSIAEHIFIHLDGNGTNINVQSKDGTTTVTAQDSTLDYTEGTALSTRVEFWIDARDPADIQVYINGALVLGAQVFRLDNAVGPLFLLAHVEKASSADVYELALDWLRVRLAEQ